MGRNRERGSWQIALNARGKTVISLTGPRMSATGTSEDLQLRLNVDICHVPTHTFHMHTAFQLPVCTHTHNIIEHLYEHIKYCKHTWAQISITMWIQDSDVGLSAGTCTAHLYPPVCTACPSRYSLPNHYVSFSSCNFPLFKISSCILFISILSVTFSGVLAP